MAALQQRVLFDARTKQGMPSSNVKLARELADLVTCYLEYPRQTGSLPNRHTKRRAKAMTRAEPPART